MKEVGSFYLYLQKRLLENCNNNLILRKEAEARILKLRISKIMIPFLFKEMEQAGLINKLNRDKFALKKIKLLQMNKKYQNKTEKRIQN